MTKTTNKIAPAQITYANLDTCEQAVANGIPVYAFNPQRGWVVCAVEPLRRAIEWHRRPENARFWWRTDLYGVVR